MYVQLLSKLFFFFKKAFIAEAVSTTGASKAADDGMVLWRDDHVRKARFFHWRTMQRRAFLSGCAKSSMKKSLLYLIFVWLDLTGHIAVVEVGAVSMLHLYGTESGICRREV